MEVLVVLTFVLASLKCAFLVPIEWGIQVGLFGSFFGFVIGELVPVLAKRCGFFYTRCGNEALWMPIVLDIKGEDVFMLCDDVTGYRWIWRRHKEFSGVSGVSLERLTRIIFMEQTVYFRMLWDSWRARGGKLFESDVDAARTSLNKMFRGEYREWMNELV